MEKQHGYYYQTNPSASPNPKDVKPLKGYTINFDDNKNWIKNLQGNVNTAFSKVTNFENTYRTHINDWQGVVNNHTDNMFSLLTKLINFINQKQLINNANDKKDIIRYYVQNNKEGKPVEKFVKQNSKNLQIPNVSESELQIDKSITDEQKKKTMIQILQPNQPKVFVALINKPPYATLSKWKYEVNFIDKNNGQTYTTTVQIGSDGNISSFR